MNKDKRIEELKDKLYDREGVKIYCNANNRDGMKIVGEEPTAEMNFKDITVKDMFKRQLDKCLREVN